MSIECGECGNEIDIEEVRDEISDFICDRLNEIVDNTFLSLGDLTLPFLTYSLPVINEILENTHTKITYLNGEFSVVESSE